jgi:hypothetical protein
VEVGEVEILEAVVVVPEDLVEILIQMVQEDLVV